MTPPSVLVADPPWSHDDQLPGRGRGASKHYGLVSLEEIKSYPIPVMAENSVRLLWRVASMQGHALAVADAWGFRAKTEIVWLKRRRCRACKGAGSTLVGASSGALVRDGRCEKCDGSGDRQWFGMGHQVRGAHETCLIATRGRNIRQNASVPSVFRARVPGGRHSAKPEEFFGLIEKLYPGPYHELFARHQRPGWTCEGDEAWGSSALAD